MKTLIRLLLVALLLVGTASTPSLADGELPPVCSPSGPRC